MEKIVEKSIDELGMYQVSSININNYRCNGFISTRSFSLSAKKVVDTVWSIISDPLCKIIQTVVNDVLHGQGKPTR